MTPDQLKLLADSEFDRASHKKNLRETAIAGLVVPYAGGVFNASINLIAYLTVSQADTVYIEDIYNNPIKANRLLLLSALQTAYEASMQSWHTELEKSNRIRRASNV